MKNVRSVAPETGRPHPFGATETPTGVNFSLYSQHATSVELLLFENPESPTPTQSHKLDPATNKSFHIWHAHIPNTQPGWGYAYRVDGPQDVDNGHRFNPQKVLLDPYAKAISTTLWNRGDACHDDDNVATSLRGLIVESGYDWEGDKPLATPTEELVIYEMHVGGFTASDSSEVDHPGTYRGVIEKIPYLKSLGVTAVELLPVFAFDDSEVLRNAEGQDLRNYWGYSTTGFFAPHHGYSSDPQAPMDEFRDMVKALHCAGICVILDVVFNHTDEGNHQGPVFSFKGIDNSTYYDLVPGDEQYYNDFTGCGNTLACNSPVGEKFVEDCLNYWVTEMHVDGFRFDEASVLTRSQDGTPLEKPPLIWNIELSETLADTKVIAEAWDAAGLYQVGYFPGDRWAEWNGKYRDDVRRFVKGDPGLIGALAQRISGSADLYQARDHAPTNSVNFIDCHDGFTLADLVSYNEKHNEANGENNNDGANDNLSWNCGWEGTTDDGTIDQLRNQQIKNFATLLMLSQGVPMMVAGDEFRRTQGGNNNAYCQDNEISWIDWNLADKNAGLLRFWQQLIDFRKSNPSLHRARYFTGETNQRGVADIAWHGTALNEPGWNDPNSRTLAFTLAGIGSDTDLHVMINSHWESHDFEVPSISRRNWRQTIDTALPSPDDFTKKPTPQKGLSNITVAPRSVVVLTNCA